MHLIAGYYLLAGQVNREVQTGINVERGEISCLTKDWKDGGYFLNVLGQYKVDETDTPCPLAAYGFGRIEATYSIVRGVDF